MHIRQQIREAVVNALTIAQPMDYIAWTISEAQTKPLTDKYHIAVSTPTLEADYSRGQMQSAPLMSLGVLIEVILKTSVNELRGTGVSTVATTAQELIDIAAENIERVIYTDTGIEAITSFIEIGSQEISFDGDADHLGTLCSINYSFYYYAQEGAPGVIY